jgi:hypothetical protein
MLSPRESVRPKQRPLAWLMRLVEELYDSRYAKDTADLRNETAAAENGDAAALQQQPFPAFVVDFFTKRYGLRALIDQNAWDLLYNVTLHRDARPEVDVFARFLSEQYDADDLLFFLYVRSVVQKEVGVSFRSRWSELGNSSNAAASPRPGTAGAEKTAGAPAPLYLTFRECQLVSRVVFGSESDPLFRTFVAMVERHIQEQEALGLAPAPAAAAAPGTKKATGGDPRRIEASQFLHLALAEYHETRPAEEGAAALDAAEDGANASAAAGDAAAAADEAEADRLYREAEAAYEARLKGAAAAPAPAASGNGDFSDADFAAAASALRRSPMFFDDLGQRMHEANESYLDAALSAAGASSLPAEVQQQIRAEVTQQLEPKVDALLAATIKTIQQRNARAAGTAPYEGTSRGLVSHFLRVLLRAADGASDPAALDGFCQDVLAHEDVKKAVEPLVALLVSYATSRLQEGQ